MRAVAKALGGDLSKYGLPVNAIRPRETVLPPDAEQGFRQWVRDNRIPYDLSPEGRNDYDMRGYWRDTGGTPGEVDPYDGRPHFPDSYKLPGNPTFSHESRFSLSKYSRWTPDGRYLVDANGDVVFDAAGER